jgi:flagellin FlaB
VKKKMKIKQSLRKLLKQNRGMVGIEAAIVLIAFVIVAAAFSFMVVNMGLFSTQRGRETIQQGVSEASSPLTLDGSIQIQSPGFDPATDVENVTGIVVPLKTLGVRYVPMHDPETEVSIRVQNHTAYANIYHGIAATDPTDSTLDTLVGGVTAEQANLFIGNSNHDTSLDYSEKGYLVISLSGNSTATEREHVWIEIRPESGAPLSIEFIVPPQLTPGWHTIGS